MIAYFDCFSGISGDMTLGALVDLGVPIDWLDQQLSAVPIEGYHLSVKKVMDHGICGSKAQVWIDESPAKGRHWPDIKNLIESSQLIEKVKHLSLRIFERLAQCEAAIHGVDVNQVHFHEVGAVDALVDIIGTAICIDRLGIETVVASAIPLGRGFTTCQHGTLPLPAPATAALLKGVPVFGTEIDQELVTPTGAAIITTLARAHGPMPPMRIQSIGYGAGSRRFDAQPNLLRIFLGQSLGGEARFSNSAISERVAVVETTLDDMNPELFGHLMDRLYTDGALDVTWQPAYGKKNRPATIVSVICPVDLRDRIVKRLLSESTTIGVRHTEMARYVLPRETISVDTPLGPIAAKRITELDGTQRLTPEYEACRQIALDRNMPLRRVYDIVQRTLGNESTESDQENP